jgi:4-alpha-glucanotransferase
VPVPETGGRFAAGRHAGIMIPLFSFPSKASWGIGEIPDLAPLSRWLDAAGLDFVQLLPVNEMQEGQSSPYSALSAMAIDPIFLALREVEDFAQSGGERALASADRVALDRVRSSTSVDHETIRAVKSKALRTAFAAFHTHHYSAGSARSARARDFDGFRERESWWLADYALFRALHEENRSRYWTEWEPGVRDRETAALQRARERLAQQMLYFEYLQWVADEQWQRARRECRRVGIFGDFPFMVSGHSADVWTRQDEFRLDVSVGVPPDAFSETGQDWGLPAYRWDVIEKRGDEWLRDRTHRCAELYDGYRIDHLVGFFRTFIREKDGTRRFGPAEEAAQRAQGERLLKLFASQGSRILAEDLGTVPDFVRESMRRLGVPGTKVFRWEREWDVDGRPFRDPAAYPALSVATTGTHDTDTMAEWWDNADDAERCQVAQIPLLRKWGFSPSVPYSNRTRDLLIKAIFHAGSDLIILPMQDVFGWRDRINTPASVGKQNWSWRLPWAVDDLVAEPAAIERARFLLPLSVRS